MRRGAPFVLGDTSPQRKLTSSPLFMWISDVVSETASNLTDRLWTANIGDQIEVPPDGKILLGFSHPVHLGLLQSALKVVEVADRKSGAGTAGGGPVGLAVAPCQSAAPWIMPYMTHPVPGRQHHLRPDHHQGPAKTQYSSDLEVLFSGLLPFRLPFNANYNNSNYPRTSYRRLDVWLPHGLSEDTPPEALARRIVLCQVTPAASAGGISVIADAGVKDGFGQGLEASSMFFWTSDVSYSFAPPRTDYPAAVLEAGVETLDTWPFLTRGVGPNTYYSVVTSIRAWELGGSLSDDRVKALVTKFLMQYGYYGLNNVVSVLGPPTITLAVPPELLSTSPDAPDWTQLTIPLKKAGGSGAPSRALLMTYATNNTVNDGRVGYAGKEEEAASQGGFAAKLLLNTSLSFTVVVSANQLTAWVLDSAAGGAAVAGAVVTVLIRPSDYFTQLPPASYAALQVTPNWEAAAAAASGDAAAAAPGRGLLTGATASAAVVGGADAGDVVPTGGIVTATESYSRVGGSSRSRSMSVVLGGSSGFSQPSVLSSQSSSSALPVVINGTTGTFHAEIVVPKDARLQPYILQLAVPSPGTSSAAITLPQPLAGAAELYSWPAVPGASLTITVADPRPPTADLKLSTPAWSPPTSVVSFTATAVSYIGASVSGAALTAVWRTPRASGLLTLTTDAAGRAEGTVDLGALPAANRSEPYDNLSIDVEWIGPTRERITRSATVVTSYTPGDVVKLQLQNPWPGARLLLQWGNDYKSRTKVYGSLSSGLVEVTLGPLADEVRGGGVIIAVLDVPRLRTSQLPPLPPADQLAVSRLFDPYAPHSHVLTATLTMRPENALAVSVAVVEASSGGGGGGGGGDGVRTIRDVDGGEVVALEPGATAEVRVTVKDSLQEDAAVPVAGSVEVTVYGVDKAFLDLLPYDLPHPEQEMVLRLAADMSVFGMNAYRLAPGAVRAVFDKLMARLAGTDPWLEPDTSVQLSNWGVAAVDVPDATYLARYTSALTNTPVAVRYESKFVVTPLFATATTDDNGVAKVKFTAPQNLGTFVLRWTAMPSQSMVRHVKPCHSQPQKEEEKTCRRSPASGGTAVQWQEGLTLPDAVPGSGGLNLTAGVGYFPAIAAIYSVLQETDSDRSYASAVPAVLWATLPAVLSYYDQPISSGYLELSSGGLSDLSTLTDPSLGLMWSESTRWYNWRPTRTDLYLNTWALFLAGLYGSTLASTSSPNAAQWSSLESTQLPNWRAAVARQLVADAVQSRQQQYSPGPYSDWYTLAWVRNARVLTSLVLHSLGTANPAPNLVAGTISEITSLLRVQGRTAYVASAPGLSSAASLEDQALSLLLLLRTGVNHQLLPKLAAYVANPASTDGYGIRSYVSYSWRDQGLAVAALSEYDKTRGSSKPDLALLADVNGLTVLQANFQSGCSTRPVAGRGEVTVSASLHFVPSALLPYPTYRGLFVEAALQLLDPLTDRPTGQRLSSVPLGSVVVLTLQLTSPDDLGPVTLAVMMPGGLEPLDPNTAAGTGGGGGGLGLSCGANWVVTDSAWGGSSFFRGWWWPMCPSQETRPQLVTFFYLALRSGTSSVAVRAVAATPGTFIFPPVRAFADNQPELSGSTAASYITVCADCDRPLFARPLPGPVGCPGECSGRGVCNLRTGRCSCQKGFGRADCSRPVAAAA
ncbi:hypothetical protein VOLCADRAFT_99419 [Volvox carteri f. nagariensis]|uniref:EGF-like domain-containing protein n=1 Tax=Volvox carteri f. nagariensis TaxID=3068 RepID=D8UHR6_VOLCA|nr:uncharacterized protein VOLCADRAFT_99419 [Volvox carteri f. nagariensis]EFJ40727.1 hypothetical protein VOLCADRAFT_99419 [Volvox carteri f. nagariensis]|eukprot:XP_002958193.1 hypothetical protein VOLCADRAFT_99419 [Volvox carteri f. nagariensis]